MKYYLYLVGTCLSEIVWVVGFNIANGWLDWIYVILFVTFDFYLLSKACEGLPTSTVYATFAGVGTVGTVLIDMYWFDNTLSLIHLVCIALIAFGVIGLHLSDHYKGVS